MTAFFTSDSHFGHANIRVYEPESRGHFATTEDMDAALIQAWNKVVKYDDQVYHLGDFAFAPEDRVLRILDQLAGQKFLIFGNHDQKIRKSKALQQKFGWCREVHEDKYDDQRVIMCHFPMMVWNKSMHGSYMLHGHCHGNLRYPFKARILDVGVDNVGFEPITMREIKRRIGNVEPHTIDHHGER